MKHQIKKIGTCEVCGNDQLLPVLNLGLNPLCDDLIPIGDLRVCKEYPIEIVFCEKCITAHQRFQVPKQELFPSSYHYRSRFTADVLNGMKELVASYEEKLGDSKNKKVLDVGCNDGSLLGFFKEKGALTYGIEPTDAYLDAQANGHIVYGDFLSEKVAHKIVLEHGKMDVITFTNVFAHIENLHEVISSLKILMASHTAIVIENHYLGAVLNGNQFDTFYHEHPRTYSYTSFEYMAQLLGVSLLDVEFPSRYGGNIRVFFGNEADINKVTKHVDIKALKARESLFSDLFFALTNKIELWKKSQQKFISDQVKSKHSKLIAKAFPGRAAILIKLLGLDEKLISAVYEKPGSLKMGHYVPGTRIPICSDEELFAMKDKNGLILNLAWHIPGEIRSYLINNEYTGLVVDIVNPEDFVLSVEMS